MEDQQKAIDEAKRLLSLMSKKSALILCEELAKKLPNINDTPPIYRKPIENYMQFYMFRLPAAINEVKQPDLNNENK